MNSNTRCIRLFTVLALVLSAVAVFLRTVACMNDLEYTFGYFSSKTMEISALTAFVIGCIVLFSYAFFANNMAVKPSFSSPATYVPTGIAAIGLIFTSVSLLLKLDGATGYTYYLILLTSVTALLAVVHFFLNAYLTDAKTELRAFFSLSTVVFLALYAAFLYFDRSLPLNSHNKLVDQLAFLLAAIFFLYESRISLGREKWKSYVSFGLIAALATAYSSIPSLIVYVFKGYTISNSIEESVLCFTLFIFIISRLILVASLSEYKENRFINAMHNYAEKREALIIESMKVHREAYSPQMTIDDILDQPIDRLPLYNDHYGDDEEDDEEDKDDEGQIQMLDLFDVIPDDVYTEDLKSDDNDESTEEEANDEEDTGN